VDLADFAAMNEVYGRRFLGEFPARSTIQVAGLPKGSRIEVEVHAVKHAARRPATARRFAPSKTRVSPAKKSLRRKPKTAPRKKRR
jgi:hypothetical protein